MSNDRMLQHHTHGPVSDGGPTPAEKRFRLVLMVAFFLFGALDAVLLMMYRPVVVWAKPKNDTAFGHEIYVRKLGSSSIDASVAAREGLWLFVENGAVHLLVKNEGGTWDRVRGYWPPWPAVEEIRATVYDDARNEWGPP